MNRYAQQQHKDLEHKKFKFYKHLKFYLMFVGLMLFVNIFMGANADFYPVAFWWGLGVVFHYLKTFGWEHLTMTQSVAEESYERRTEVPAEPEEEEFVELKQPQRAWRDRDLV
ncbi:MAG: 2TM domain-containing protein [Saprospiraceae bacterium]